jgi:hypothetical protein
MPHHPSQEKTRRLVKQYRTEIAASTSSVFSTLAAFPLDSVKTRMQTYKYDGFLDCVKHTYRTENLRGFFRGTPAPANNHSIIANDGHICRRNRANG